MTQIKSGFLACLNGFFGLVHGVFLGQSARIMSGVDPTKQQTVHFNAASQLTQTGHGPLPGDGIRAPVVTGPSEVQINVVQGNRSVGQPANAAGFYLVRQNPGSSVCGPASMRHYTGTSFPSIAEFNAEKSRMVAPLLQTTISQITNTLEELTDTRVGDILRTNQRLGGSAAQQTIEDQMAVLAASITLVNPPADIARDAESLAHALVAGLPLLTLWRNPYANPGEAETLRGIADLIREDFGSVEVGGADPDTPMAMLQRLDPKTQFLSVGNTDLPESVDYSAIFNGLAAIAPNTDRAIVCIRGHFSTIRKAGNEWHLLESDGPRSGVHGPGRSVAWPHTNEPFIGVIFSVANNVGETLHRALAPLRK